MMLPTRALVGDLAIRMTVGLKWDVSRRSKARDASFRETRVEAADGTEILAIEIKVYRDGRATWTCEDNLGIARMSAWPMKRGMSANVSSDAATNQVLDFAREYLRERISAAIAIAQWLRWSGRLWKRNDNASDKQPGVYKPHKEWPNKPVPECRGPLVCCICKALRNRVPGRMNPRRVAIANGKPLHFVAYDRSTCKGWKR